ncbi:MAG: hypothetical protein N2691_05210 [Patescibacteria group bacterium]|nr:hypothetical protein [Patescibacteria group bacterium]
MRREMIGILGIGVLVLAALIAGFTVIGSPLDQSAIRYDESRYNDFQQISNRINSFYQNRNRLPANLNELETNVLNTIDPVSGEQYVYQVSGEANYQLCTTFSTTLEEFRRNTTQSYYDLPLQHNKGYSCIEFVIPAYIRETKITPVQM